MVRILEVLSVDYEEKGKAAEAEVKASPEENGPNEEEMPVFTDMEEPWDTGEEFTGACDVASAQEQGQEEAGEAAAEAMPEEAAMEMPPQAPQRKGKSFMGVVFEYLQSILMAFFIAIIIMAFLGRSYMVEGASMEKTLFNSERVLVEKVSYYLGEPKRGDIVVLMNPRQQKYGNWFLDTFGFVKDIFVVDMTTRPYIKRVIGVVGDTIEVRGGKAYLNGEMLEEPYVSEEIWWDYGPTTVPEGYVFVMGDNRNHSDDSRGSVGFLETDRILGKAVVRFWPLNKVTAFTRPEVFKGM